LTLSRKEKASRGANPARLYQGRKDRADHSQPKYSQPAIFPKAFDSDKHIRAARHAMSDAFVMLKGFPSRIRYSYFVGSDGKLIARAERRVGT